MSINKLSAHPGVQLPSAVTRTAIAGLLSAVAVAVAPLVLLLGWWSLLIPIYAVCVVFAVLVPGRFIFPLLATCVVIEPNAIDFTMPLSIAFHYMPPGVETPLTISPFEVLLSITSVSLVLRTRTNDYVRPKLPALVWALPVLMFVGLAWGLRNGSETNFAYHEMRGLIFGAIAFVAIWRLDGLREQVVMRWAIGSSFLLGLVLLARYQFYLRSGELGITSELAYAHEDAVYLAFGVLLGTVLFLKAEAMPVRMFAVVHVLVNLSALVASGRRAGTLALCVGVIGFGWLLFKHRPVLVVAVAVPLLMCSSVYLAAYWNKEYGALAQPARAIKSQIDPSDRDQSSDQYRETEAYNVEQTIRFNRPLGIGFGQPFGQFQPLPDLRSFWPLQHYTPHQNILWLWLKMGVLGVSAFLALWAMAFRRCIVHANSYGKETVPFASILVACGLLMFLAYAKIDLALIATRSAVGLAILVAVALRLPAINGSLGGRGVAMSKKVAGDMKWPTST